MTSLSFIACERTGIGVPYPAEPRLEFDEYDLHVSASAEPLTIRWRGCEEAVYSLRLSAAGSDLTAGIADNSTVDDLLVHTMAIPVETFIKFASDIGQDVTLDGPDVDVVLSVIATAKEGRELSKFATYTQSATIHLIPM